MLTCYNDDPTFAPAGKSSRPFILHAVDGYQHALDQQQVLIKTGIDDNEQNGHVAHTIASLHPKRIKLVVAKVS
jgi:hypothetical protein